MGEFARNLTRGWLSGRGGSRAFHLLERKHLHLGLELVQVVRPDRHHSASLGEVGRAVVGAAERVADGVGKLVLDHIRTKAQHFIEERARHRAEAVSAHLGGGDAQPSHGRQYSVVAHGPRVGACGWEHIAARPGQRLQVAQNRNGLRGQRNDVFRLGLAGRESPLPLSLGKSQDFDRMPDLSGRSRKSSSWHSSNRTDGV